MKKIVKSAFLAASIGLLASVISAPALADAGKAINDAKMAYKQALEVGGAWRDTAKMIEQAEKLLANGKSAEAEKLAREAEAQSMLGHIQATGQSLDNLHI